VDNDLRIIDMGDPAHPSARGKLTLDRASDISVDGDQLSLFGSESSLVLASVDVHDPDHPAIIANVSAPPLLSGARRISSWLAWGAIDPTAYPPMRPALIDIHNPTAVSIIGHYPGCAAGCPLPPPDPAVGAKSQVTFISDTGEILRLAIFPSLTSRYRRGGPGSVMSLQAHDLPPNQSLELRVNGVSAGAVPTGEGDVAMALGFGLDTAPGRYLLSLGTPGGAALISTIIEISAAPLASIRSGAASEAISLSAPAGLSPIMQLELPVVIR
jgi:hypothetical protein